MDFTTNDCLVGMAIIAITIIIFISLVSKGD
jgi:hypothetical protein